MVAAAATPTVTGGPSARPPPLGPWSRRRSSRSAATGDSSTVPVGAVAMLLRLLGGALTGLRRTLR